MASSERAEADAASVATAAPAAAPRHRLSLSPHARPGREGVWPRREADAPSGATTARP